MTKMFPPHRPKHQALTDLAPLRGYIEGYYGRLLRWDDRRDIISHLSALGMQAYLYAPKEDPCHRLNWRRPYDADWQASFRETCTHADNLGITMIGGVAPGLDYDYLHINTGDDWDSLFSKCVMMRDLGAGAIALLLDDIQPDLTAETGTPEGTAHAQLANALYKALDVPILLVPRIYADEVMHHDLMTPGADDDAYWPNLAEALHPDITLLVCGAYVIAPHTDLTGTAMVAAGVAASQVVIWDNLYAHDYCPRRLFTGPWRGRGKDQHIMLNPTGMVATDKFLLTVMTGQGEDDAWRDALSAHGVPDAFINVADFFGLPPIQDNAAIPNMDDPDIYLDALDELLWRWKTPLAQEWYPFLMGLRQDILYAAGRMDKLRVEKSYPMLLKAQMKPHEQGS